MSSVLQKEKVYVITCIRKSSPYDKRIIYNRAYNYSDNWEFEKQLLEFWKLEEFTILNVELSNMKD